MKSDALPAKNRYELIDALRGTAIAMMFSFHISYDLNHFGFITTDFYHNPFWLNYRIVIVSTFLTVMGMSLYIAHHNGLRRDNYLHRLGWLVICAVLISIGTYFLFGRRFIYFGIIHFIAVASVLALPFIRLYWTNLILGAGIIIVSNYVSLDVMDPRYLNWIGLMHGKPFTEDYAPIFPWFGVVLLGIFLARWAYTEQRIRLFSQWHSRLTVFRVLRFAGRHSLIIYMVHQPVFFGTIALIHKLTSA
ncbi:MAG: heparan-alpha-glucosaminide N-acetyltransferase [Gammaproteobacteria bacterium]|jgi:uncharacterized membrane protein